MSIQTLSKRFAVAIAICLILQTVGTQNFANPAAPARADSPPEGNEPSAQGERPFQLPFAEPSGPATWMLGQPYGNTTGAYYRRHTLYAASGGIHFGLDLSAPCGTDVLAIADGVVFAVDGPYGAAPHNLMIDHPQLGYASMYGHLLEAPRLAPGQRVEQGELIAVVGDSEGNCHRRPHLHLELRDLEYHARKYNPIPLIEADWDSLALTGSSGLSFMRDLAEPRKWQTLYDQPEAWTGGPIVNEFEDTWPFDWSKREPSAVGLASPEEATTPHTPSPPTDPLLETSVGRQITRGECCTKPHWSEDSTQVHFVDRPTPDEPLGVWGVDLKQPDAVPRLIEERLAIFSPDGNLIAYPDRENGLAIVQRLGDGQRWEVDTQEHAVSFTPDSRGLIWTTFDEDAPWDTREETIWLADLDGGNSQAILSARRTDSIDWLSDDELLMAQGYPDTSDVRLFKLSVSDSTQTTLREGTRMRGLALSPDKRHLVYYVRFEPDDAQNGVWLMDLHNPAQPAQRLPFFATYRWRDDHRLIYVPLDPGSASHDFYEYDVLTGQTRPLFPGGSGLKIANNDWQVSPDGRSIALVAANGTELDGIWILDIAASGSAFAGYNSNAVLSGQVISGEQRVGGSAQE
jgi:hypothetical protein